MNYIPQQYNFTRTDTDELGKIGFVLNEEDGAGVPFESFMQKHFPNFNLLALLKVADMQFKGTTNKAIDKFLDYTDSKKILRIQYCNKYSSEADALLFIRTFSNKNDAIEVSHDFCVIPESSRGNGIIKPVFKESLQQYVNMKAEKISVHAALSGGGYAWAKHGFVAIDKSEVDVILKDAESKLNSADFAVVKKIYDVYYSRKPIKNQFPMDLWANLPYMKAVLRGSNWHGELNLQNKEQFTNFKDYVSRQS